MWFTQHLPWIYGDEAAAFAAARAQHKGVMVDFAASWCGPCRELEKTFGDSDVYDAVTASFVPLKLDVSTDNETNEALKTKYDTLNLPGVVFLDAKETALVHVRKEVDAPEMLVHIQAAVTVLHGGRLAENCQ